MLGSKGHPGYMDTLPGLFLIIKWMF